VTAVFSDSVLAVCRDATRSDSGVPHKALNWSSVVLSTVLGLAAPLRAYPQAESGGSAQASAPVTASAPPSQTMPDQRVQQIRLQLSQTSDGNEHYRLLTELAQGGGRGRYEPRRFFLRPCDHPGSGDGGARRHARRTLLRQPVSHRTGQPALLCRCAPHVVSWACLGGALHNRR
jgi:hypothetical protein